MAGVEAFKQPHRLPYYEQKLHAAQIMAEGLSAIRTYHIEHYGPIDTTNDPTASGWIGLPSSPITTNKGYLDAKETTINPNWAAVVVELLHEAGVREGNLVATGFSGSFPALNLAVLSACKAMNLKVIAISSAGASSWGANRPGLTWLDMEQILLKRKIISYRSVAASLGGTGDSAENLSQKGIAILMQAIENSGAEYLEAHADFSEGLDLRMNCYLKHAGDTRIKAYLNVGGGTLSVGTQKGKHLYSPGLNKYPPVRALAVDSILSRFARQGTPIIHLSGIRTIARQFNLPLSPESTPQPGEGPLFQTLVYNKWLTLGGLVLLGVSWWLFVKTNVGNILFGRQAPSAGTPKL